MALQILDEAVNVSICKIDTEGKDISVIKGLHAYLDAQVIDYFIFEYQDLSYSEINRILIANHYTIYPMVRNKNSLVNSLDNYPKNSKPLLNCIAVSSKKKNKFIKLFRIE